MAFVTPTALPNSTTSRRTSRHAARDPRTRPTATATPNKHNSIKTSKPTSPPTPLRSQKPRTRTAAPVVDSRIASVQETHHWIVVKNSSQRTFERAAVAQTDTTTRLESKIDTGALHRWLLREVPDPTLGFLDNSLRNRDARYVVMETFKADVARANPAVTRRWLSAVERLAPAVGAVDVRSLTYDNVFTSKLHDATFNPNENVIVVESVNVDMARGDNLAEVADILQSTAEASVAAGDCLEFCVLHSPSEQGFFKTIEVYKDADALRNHMDGHDRVFERRSQGRVVQGQRSRHTFRPVVFA